VSRLSRKCGSLEVSQPYGPSRPVTERGLSFFLLEGEERVHCGDPKDLSVSNIMCYKDARLVSCDVEVHILNKNHSSVNTDNDLRNKT
jgi:hypothetical protein